ncbi:Uncharacterised protein [Vibrio cholerae]|nr:Uncharacterised protein [Vibrio cholerae]
MVRAGKSCRLPALYRLRQPRRLYSQCADPDRGPVSREDPPVPPSADLLSWWRTLQSLRFPRALSSRSSVRFPCAWRF